MCIIKITKMLHLKISFSSRQTEVVVNSWGVSMVYIMGRFFGSFSMCCWVCARHCYLYDVPWLIRRAAALSLIRLFASWDYFMHAWVKLAVRCFATTVARSSIWLQSCLAAALSTSVNTSGSSDCHVGWAISEAAFPFSLRRSSSWNKGASILFQ